jgi:phosphoglycerate dehydrogenase-like enzyme
MTRPRALVAIDDASLVARLFDVDALGRLRGIVALDAAPSPFPQLVDAAGVEILITGWGSPRLTATLLDALPDLKAVFHAAGSVKGVVSPAVWERGIRVSSCAEANALPVAEYALAMILLSARGVTGAMETYRATGDLSASHPRGTVGTYGLMVGIVGASRIGRRLLELLRPFDIETVLYDPSLSAADAAALGTRLASLEEVLRASQIVSLHAPLLPATKRMIGAPELALMRDGATLINTARGALVDTGALVAELQTRRILAVLDVTDPEPLPADHPLWSAPGVVLTPHIAGSMGNELRRMGDHTVAEVDRFVSFGTMKFEVHHRDLAMSA